MAVKSLAAGSMETGNVIYLIIQIPLQNQLKH